MAATYTDRLDGLTTAVAFKGPARVVATANLTLSGLQTIDGVTVAASDRVLATGQTDASENGVWLVQSGAWTRALDWNGSRDIVGGTQIYVTSGSAYTGSIWRVTGNGAYIVGTDNVTITLLILPSSLPAMPDGATGDGTTNDTAALQAWLDGLNGRLGVLPPGTYKFSQLTIPNDANISARGATWRSDGSLTTAGDITLAIGNGVSIDDLVVTTPGTETNTDIIEIGSNFTAGLVDVRADAQRAGGGITCTGDNVVIERLVTRKIDRPLHLYNTSVVAQTTGSYIGYIDVEDYVRVFRADFCSFHTGDIRAVGRSANASKSAGHNVVLIVGCANWSIGDIYSEDCGEHVVRIGGSTGSHMVTKNYRIGVITGISPGGCVLKVNPTLLVSAGVTEKAYNGNVAGVIGVDVGEATIEGNEELMRLTHVVGLKIGFARSYVDQQAASSQYTLQINDANGVTIGELESANANAGFVNILGTSDVDGIDYFGGDVTALRIDRVIGVCAGNNAIGVSTAFNVGRVSIGLDGIRGFTTNVISWSGTLTDDFELKGSVGGTVAPVYSGVPNSDEFIVNVRYNNTRAMGRIAHIRGSGVQEIALPTFDPADYDAGANGLFLTNAAGTEGSGNFGPALEFSRAGSGRRAAAIATRQGSSDAKEVGLDFYIGDTNSTANEALILALRLLYTGALYTPLLPTYADNAAAVSGGLATHTVYKTATGEVRIVV